MHNPVAEVSRLLVENRPLNFWPWRTRFRKSPRHESYRQHATVQWHVAFMLIKALDTLWLRLLLTSYRLARVH